jgi:hypothetical protein
MAWMTVIARTFEDIALRLFVRLMRILFIQSLKGRSVGLGPASSPACRTVRVSALVSEAVAAGHSRAASPSGGRSPTSIGMSDYKTTKRPAPGQPTTGLGRPSPCDHPGRRRRARGRDRASPGGRPPSSGTASAPFPIVTPHGGRAAPASAGTGGRFSRNGTPGPVQRSFRRLRAAHAWS